MKKIKCFPFFQFMLRGSDIAIFLCSVDHINKIPTLNLKNGSAPEPKSTKLKTHCSLKLQKFRKTMCLKSFFNFLTGAEICQIFHIQMVFSFWQWFWRNNKRLRVFVQSSVQYMCSRQVIMKLVQQDNSSHNQDKSFHNKKN